MPVPDDGKALFADNCAACHGTGGMGDGPLAAQLQSAPANLTRIALDADGNFPRARVMSIIDGYARSDLGGPGMPEFGALLEGDLIPFDSGDGVLTPTPRKLVAVLEYLIELQAEP